jgi:hypothetical protein
MPAITAGARHQHQNHEGCGSGDQMRRMTATQSNRQINPRRAVHIPRHLFGRSSYCGTSAKLFWASSAHCPSGNARGSPLSALLIINSRAREGSESLINPAARAH